MYSLHCHSLTRIQYFFTSFTLPTFFFFYILSLFLFFFFFFLIFRPPPRSPLFPYTTLSRSPPASTRTRRFAQSPSAPSCPASWRAPPRASRSTTCRYSVCARLSPPHATGSPAPSRS